NPNEAGTPLLTDIKPIVIVNRMVTSAAYITTATGIVYWFATYSGDVNYISVHRGFPACTIGPATPAITTTAQPTSAMVESSFADQATISGGFTPTGTVTFFLYDNPTGTGTPLFTDTETLVNGTATTSGSGYTATVAGTDYWLATYNGDANNSSVST